MIKKFYKSFYLHDRFFYSMSGLAIIYIVGYFSMTVFFIAHLCLLVLSVLVVIDLILLYSKPDGLSGSRLLPERFSNGDFNNVKLIIRNNYKFSVSIDIIDELPFQLQIRDFIRKLEVNALNEIELTYKLKPVERGEYSFGDLNLYACSLIRFVKKRYKFDANKMIKVYPSFLQLKKYELSAFNNRLEPGVKKFRKIGTTIEFDNIRKYINGDDYRAINWKATARKRELMVNQFQDERAQHIYLIIDKSRTMKMPFQGMSLLDYSINASLAMASIILKKYDKPGILTFNNNISFFLKSDNKKNQMLKINEALYNQATGFLESDYAMLSSYIQSYIKQRSLIVLFTNFETSSSVQRNISYFKSIGSKHLLLVIFFKNTELYSLMEDKADDLKSVYYKVIAEKMAFEKKQLIKELNQNGILTLYTEPSSLSIDIINKYLEIKSKRIL